MLAPMNTWISSSAALRPTGAGSTGWPADLTPTDAAQASDVAGRQAAAWFNAPVVEGSQVLRAPVQPGAGDADTLRQRFLSSLQDTQAT